ncbi:peptidase M10A and M12B matrixin and adamalysin [Natrinema halophilum]|uniref:Peptidase M10A and M12B matrixin and adamalysin n=1 Tax=Natrinema halophilum TaxID=1699371 RepID=A0A7D5KQR0_9EURY|nr:peptidase M10A and M12B matrixin and adamalysin [Natrinema halophilum]QLG48597.1 peptidase M10A and M12B matrixin and adamalysin [Natrinema halophilum]
MNRRAFFGTVGSAISLGTLAYTTRRSPETLSVRIWLSEQASTYDGVSDRIHDYLERMLDFEFWSLEFTVGGTVSVSTEDAARLMKRGEWPKAVAEGTLGRRDIEPVSDVNLLVTDGEMKVAPTGFGIPRIASVGGARHIAALESFEELVADRDRDIVPNTTPARTIQVLVHEAGHALGLKHDHGVAFVYDGALIATPMLSSYAWDPDYDGDRSRCGTAIPAAADRERKLSLSFSSCARRALANHGSGFS